MHATRLHNLSSSGSPFSSRLLTLTWPLPQGPKAKGLILSLQMMLEVPPCPRVSTTLHGDIMMTNPTIRSSAVTKRLMHLRAVKACKTANDIMTTIVLTTRTVCRALISCLTANFLFFQTNQIPTRIKMGTLGDIRLLQSRLDLLARACLSPRLLNTYTDRGHAIHIPLGPQSAPYHYRRRKLRISFLILRRSLVSSAIQCATWYVCQLRHGACLLTRSSSTS